MPYKFESEKMKMRREDKKNIKLTLEQRDEIKALYASGLYSQRELARKFNVSRTLIQLYSNDEKLKKHKESFKKRQADGRYYNKEREREYAKTYRKNKKELYLKNKLITKEN